MRMPVLVGRVMARGVPLAAGGSARLQVPLQRLDTGSIALDNVLDVGDPVKVYLKLVELSQDLGVAGDLGVGAIDDVASPVVLDLGEHLGLLAQILHVLLDVGHQSVEVPAKGGEGRAVEQQESLAACPAGSARAAGADGEALPGAEGCLSLAQELELLGSEP